MLTKTLQELMEDLSEWQTNTFPNQTAVGKSYHLQKEIKELIEALELVEKEPTIENITKLTKEIADCQMLIMAVTLKLGFGSYDLLHFTQSKLEINKLRKWQEPDENGACQHVEE